MDSTRNAKTSASDEAQLRLRWELLSISARRTEMGFGGCLTWGETLVDLKDLPADACSEGPALLVRGPLRCCWN